MVHLLNGGLSGGNSNKRALENGHHCSSLGDTPKFKSRKVSAVRDFPRGCGRDAQPIIPEPQQNVAVAVGGDGEVQSFKVMESPVGVDTNGNMVAPHLVSVGEAIEGDGGIGMVTQLCTAIEANELRIPADPEHPAILDAPIGNDIAVVEKAVGTEKSAESQIQSNEILGNPVGMQADISLDDLVGNVEAEVMDGMDNQVEKNVLDIKPVDIELPKDSQRKSFEISEEMNRNEAQPLEIVDSLALVNHVPEENVKASSEAGLMVDREVLLKDKAVPSPKDKFRRRRVSAVRDFPLHCGRNAPPLSREEYLRIASGDKSLIGIGKGVAGEEGGSEGKGGTVSLPNGVSSSVRVKVCEEGEVSARTDIVIHEPVGDVKRRPSNDAFTSGHDEEPLIVNALMAAPHCRWREGKMVSSSDDIKTGASANKHKAAQLKKSKVVSKKSTIKEDSSGRPSLKMDSVSVYKDAHGTPGQPAVKDEEEHGEHSGPSQDLTSGHTPDIKVALLHHGPNSSGSDARNKVRGTIHLFRTICKKLLEGGGEKTKLDGKRIDLEAVKVMKKQGIDVAGKKNVGAAPGVEVGDEFQYRVELAIVGVHRLYQAGIDYMKLKGMLVAISIVSSGAYANDKEGADSLIYCGQGGNTIGKDKEPEDQKLERGNLALKNSITVKNPVRVILGYKETKTSNVADSRNKIVTTYVYDGLYTVKDYWQEEGKHGKQVFMFKLKKIPGQPEHSWKGVKKSNK